MDKDIARILDGMADFESRLSLLENSDNTAWIRRLEERLTDLEAKFGLIQEKPWTRKQWDMVKQIQAEITYLMNKLNAHTDASKKKKEDKYTEYL